MRSGIAKLASGEREESDRSSFFFINAGRPRASFRPPITHGDRVVWRRWLLGSSAVYACAVGVVLLIANGNHAGSLEATVQLERLAGRLAQIRSLPAETSREIKLLLLERRYDCAHTPCTPELQARNRVARERLLSLIQVKELEIQAGAMVNRLEGHAR
jgi:hypothetical protein